MVGTLPARRPARALLAQQELRGHGHRPRDRRGEAEPRRHRSLLLPRGRAGGAEREPEGDAGAGPAVDVDRPPRGRDRAVPVHGPGRVPDAGLPRPARGPQARHALRLQHAGELHALRDRPEGERHAARRLPAAAPVRAAGDPQPEVGRDPEGRFPRRLRPVGDDRGHRPLRPALPAEGRVGREAAPARRVGGGRDRATGLERQQPGERLGAGLRLPVLALPPRRLPRRRGLRPVLHRDAGAGRGHRDHERRARHAGRPQSRVGAPPARDEGGAPAGRRARPRTA